MEKNNTKDDFVNEEEFNQMLDEAIQKQDSMDKKPCWTQQRVDDVIGKVEAYKLAPELKLSRTSEQYYYGKKYDVIYMGNKKHLISLRKSQSDKTVQIVPTQDYYQILTDIHKTTRHGGRDKIVKVLKKKYFIPVTIIQEYLKLCKVCTTKKCFPKRPSLPPTIRTTPIHPPESIPKPLNELQYRGQVDFIDLQKSPDGPYKWLLHYEISKSKFCLLKPLTSIRVSEIAKELLKIFLEIGFPVILQSRSGREFTAAIIEEIASIWPSNKIINGKPQSIDQHSTHNIEQMLREWLLDNKSTNWSFGCSWVQFQRNTRYNLDIKKTPFKALFGTEPTSGLNSTNIPTALLDTIVNEEDLENTMDMNPEESYNFETNIENIKMEEDYSFSSDIPSEINPSTSHLQEVLIDSTSMKTT